MPAATHINPEGLHSNPAFSWAVRIPADAEVTDVVKWTIFYTEDGDVSGGLAAFGEFWPADAAPPAISVIKVLDVGPPGALIEIEAVAAVKA